MAYNFQQPFLGFGGGLQTLHGAGVGVGGWKELGRTTLGSSNVNVDVSSIADKRYYKILFSGLENSGSIYPFMRVGNSTIDTGSNYATRYTGNGAADSTNASRTNMLVEGALGGSVGQQFSVNYIANLSAKEKLHLVHNVQQNTAGAGTAPSRGECANKWANTSNVIDIIRMYEANANNWGIGSEMVVLGWDPADTHTDNFWGELSSVTAGGASTNISSGTITAKKYLWVQAWLESTSAHVTNMTFNNDTTTYAYRNSDNGGADATSTSDSDIEIHQSTSTGIFVNMFIINNSANEKLVIGHTVGQSTAGAATAPIRREFVGKHDNTSSQITEIDLDSSSGNWSSNSIIKVWGSD